MKTGVLLVNLVTMSIAAPNCPPGWTFFQDNCYRWYNGPNRLSWDDAQSFCVNVSSEDCSGCNSNLVSISSAEENEFLLDYWKASREPLGQDYWIGYKTFKIPIIDTYFYWRFKWNDGSEETYTNWDTDEPSFGVEYPYCAVMWKGATARLRDIGKWDDQPCSLKKAFICKIPFCY